MTTVRVKEYGVVCAESFKDTVIVATVPIILYPGENVMEGGLLLVSYESCELTKANVTDDPSSST